MAQPVSATQLWVLRHFLFVLHPVCYHFWRQSQCAGCTFNYFCHFFWTTCYTSYRLCNSSLHCKHRRQSHGMSYISTKFNFEFSIKLVFHVKMIHFDPNSNSTGRLAAVIWVIKSKTLISHQNLLSLFKSSQLKININNIRLIYPFIISHMLTLFQNIKIILSQNCTTNF